MKVSIRLAVLSALFSAAVASSGALAQSATSADAPMNDGRYIIKMRASGASRVQTDSGDEVRRGRGAATAAGGIVLGELREQKSVVAMLTDDGAVRLKNDPGVETIEPDYRRYPQAQSVPFGIPMVQANDPFFIANPTTSAAMVCIIDSGYQLSHEDLADFRTGPDGARVTGGGIVSGTLNSGTGNWFEDSCGHGTHVAGTIAALDNSVGVPGVNGNGALNIHVQKVFNGSTCAWTYASDLVSALNNCVTAAQQSGKRMVVSMSLGGAGLVQSEAAAFTAADNAGYLSIAAAGNGASTAVSYPAGHAAVMSVAAVDSLENLASFSQRNADVEIAAPGVNVNSTVAGGYAPAGCTSNCYTTLSGTSMATPHVSGVAALVWSLLPDRSNSQVRNALTSSAKDKGTVGRDSSFGYGIVQAKAAYEALLATPPSGQTPQPSVGVAYSLSAASLDFGATLANVSTTKSVRLSNDGTVSWPLALTLSNTPTSEFTASHNCVVPVLPGATCDVTVIFKPTTVGTKSGSIAVGASSGLVETTVVALVGTSVSPPFSVGPASLSFASQIVGSPSSPMTVTLTNDGNAALALTTSSFAFAPTGQFSQTHNCGTSLAANATCVVSVVFRPSTAGSKTSILSVTPTGATAKTVSLSGTAISHPLTTSPTSISFARTNVGATSAATTVTLRNGGAGVVTLSPLALGGTNPSQYAFSANTCGATLALAGTCTFSVVFKPTSAGSKPATVLVASSGLPTLSVALSGTGR